MKGYLLDTNHCSQIMDGNPAVLHRLDKLGNAGVATCVVVEGELIFMAENSERRTENLGRVQSFLRGMQVLLVDRETANCYGSLKAALIRHYGPKERAKRRRTDVQTLGFEENDLWVAALALRGELTVVSADSDFSRFAAASDLLVEDWSATAPE